MKTRDEYMKELIEEWHRDTIAYEKSEMNMKFYTPETSLSEKALGLFFLLLWIYLLYKGVLGMIWVLKMILGA